MSKIEKKSLNVYGIYYVSPSVRILMSTGEIEYVRDSVEKAMYIEAYREFMEWNDNYVSLTIDTSNVVCGYNAYMRQKDMYDKQFDDYFNLYQYDIPGDIIMTLYKFPIENDSVYKSVEVIEERNINRPLDQSRVNLRISIFFERHDGTWESGREWQYEELFDCGQCIGG
jgi:hypothetical protein